MKVHPRLISYNLDRFSTAICQWTVDALREADASLESRYGEDWRANWLEDTHARLAYLSQSVSVESLPLFLDSIAGSKLSFQARELPEEDLRRSLRHLRAVLSSELPKGSAEPALAFLDAADERFDELAPHEPPLRVDGPRTQKVLRYLEAVLNGDDREAENVLQSAVDQGMSAPEVFEEIVHPAQVEIGRMWVLGEVSIPEEHQATAIAVSALARLLGRMPRGAPGDRSIVVTSVEGELHDVGVRLVSDLLRIDGWRVTCLGANVPVRDVVECTQVQEPDVVALSTTSSLHVRACAETVDELKRLSPRPKILVAGRPFQVDGDLWRRLGADGFARTATEAVERAARLRS